MTDDINYTLLDRYRAGECTPAERASVEIALAADPGAAARLDWLRLLADAAPRLGEGADADAEWRSLRSRLMLPATPPDAASQRRGRPMTLSLRTRRSRWSTIVPWAAAAVVVVAVAAVLESRPKTPRTVAQGEPRVYETRAGQRATIELRDGTRVVLGPRSVLTVPDRYDAATRDVALDGRAYFEVAHDSATPFRVRSRGAITQVLGTKFDVSAYAADTATIVVVAEGRVAFDVADTSRAVASGVLLARGDAGRLTPQGVIRVSHDVNVTRYTAWIRGRLEFVNTPLRDVIPQLERWYDLDIHIDDPALAARPLTAELDNESAAGMLQILGAALECQVRHAGREVVLSARHGPA